MAVDFETVRQIALSFPGVEEGLSYRMPCLRARKKIVARLCEDGETLAVKVGHVEKDFLLQAEPEVYFTTDHYNGYPSILIRLAKISAEDLHDVLGKAWRRVATKRDIKAYETRTHDSP